ncbi:hypothetical protein [Shinella zoogloeoides]|uniref:Uncharacterized protein n=1 Tax=Shinella zoogloeoides TaxID=352475 RepID=A0A6N8THA1_SHIZO|nr:hypothetical protein [Shinella zoogloeoides]MXO00554.1 hypothetical protein [Shinella zoogloeoides]UEX79984.1 hypothetical protein K8M09_10095 [Shinella zoogloeoides]
MTKTDRPACELVRRALGAIMASDTFARSERLRSFLSYIVENELSGKAAQLKGYSIGIDVFSRAPGFDAGNDPLVRVQAGKLRKLLEQYYQTEGAADPLRIFVPLGSYVPEYRLFQPDRQDAAAPASRASRPKPQGRRSWLPAPVSSPLALFSLLPLIFLAPSVYPETTNAAIAKAQSTLFAQGSAASEAPALPYLQIVQCWPAGGDCNTLAAAISKFAGYYKTVHIGGPYGTNAPDPLSYAIRIENRPDGSGIYARLIHEKTGATVYTRHFTRQQLRSETGLAYEAVAFAARAFSASGPLYRHAARTGTASGIMECLAREERRPPRGLLQAGQARDCVASASKALADAGLRKTIAR